MAANKTKIILKAHKRQNHDLTLLLCVEVHISLQNPTEVAGTFIGTSTEI